MLNQAQLIGNLGRDPEVRTMNNGDKVCNFSIATTESWRDKSSGERKERTEWHNIVIFGPLAEVAEKYLQKGSKVYVQGKLATRKWQDKNGVDKYTTEVVLQGFSSVLEMLGDPQQNQRDGGGRSDRGSDQRDISRGDGYNRGGGKFSSSDMDDEIPF